MGRPKSEDYVVKKIDKKLWDYITDYSEKKNLNNYRKASEEIAKWIEDIEKKHKF